MYSDADLDTLCAMVRRHPAAFVLFNNQAMVADAPRFRARVLAGRSP